MHRLVLDIEPALGEKLLHIVMEGNDYGEAYTVIVWWAIEPRKQ